MMSQLLAKQTLVGANLGVMLLFVAVFVGMCLWVMRSGSEKIYDEISKLPLTEGDEKNV